MVGPDDSTELWRHPLPAIFSVEQLKTMETFLYNMAIPGLFVFIFVFKAYFVYSK